MILWHENKRQINLRKHGIDLDPHRHADRQETKAYFARVQR